MGIELPETYERLLFGPIRNIDQSGMWTCQGYGPIMDVDQSGKWTNQNKYKIIYN